MSKDDLLRRAAVALNDWTHTDAAEFCDPENVEQARRRIEEAGGTVAYIADLVSEINAFLAQPDQADRFKDFPVNDWNEPIIYDTNEIDQITHALTGDEGEDDSVTVLHGLVGYLNIVHPGKTMTQILIETEEAEPAAWRFRWGKNHSWSNWRTCKVDHDHFKRDGCEIEYAYTHPQHVPTSDTSQERVDKAAKQRHEQGEPVVSREVSTKPVVSQNLPEVSDKQPARLTDELPAFNEWFHAVWLGDKENGQTIPINGDKGYTKYLDDRMLALGAWMQRAAHGIKEGGAT